MDDLEKELAMLEGLPVQEVASVVIPAQTVATNVVSAQPSVAEVAQQANDNAAVNAVYASTTAPQPQPVPTAVPQAQPQPVPVNVQPAPQPVQAAPTTNIMEDKPVFVNLMESTYETTTDFLSIKQGEATRIALFTLNSAPIYIHYVEGLGKIKCLSEHNAAGWTIGAEKCCCKFPGKDGKPQRAKSRMILPVIEYPVSKNDGKTLVQGQPELRFFDMNYMDIKALKEILNANSEYESFDIRVSVPSQGEYKTKSMIPVTPSLRTQYANFNALTNVDEEAFKTAIKEAARTVSEETVQQYLQKALQEEATVNAAIASIASNSAAPSDISQVNLMG